MMQMIKYSTCVIGSVYHNVAVQIIHVCHQRPTVCLHSMSVHQSLIFEFLGHQGALVTYFLSKSVKYPTVSKCAKLYAYES